MLRAAVRRQLRPVASSSQRRTFVSTVLLTKSWESETAVTLRQEAKNRGLSQKGNKATLITRLQEYEQQSAFQHTSSPAPPSPIQSQQTRLASTTEAPAPTTEVPGVPSSSEPPTPPASYPKIYLDMIPDATQVVLDPPVQVPFVPDFWESSRVKAASEPPTEPTESSQPNLIAVAGDATHISASPSHNLYTDFESTSKELQPSSKDKSFFEDIAEDLFIPTSFYPKQGTQAADLMPVTNTSGSQEKDYSRTLDQEEKNGLWILFGVFVGSWVVASVLERPSKFAEKKEEERAAEESTKPVSAKH